MTTPNAKTPDTSRREFVKTSTLAASGAIAVAAKLCPAVHAAGNDLIRVGLIGCGGRGTGAASQALMADSRVQLTAMGDAFEDRLQLSLKSLNKIEGQLEIELNAVNDNPLIFPDSDEAVSAGL